MKRKLTKGAKIKKKISNGNLFKNAIKRTVKRHEEYNGVFSFLPEALTHTHILSHSHTHTQLELLLFTYLKLKFGRF